MPSVWSCGGDSTSSTRIRLQNTKCKRPDYKLLSSSYKLQRSLTLLHIRILACPILLLLAAARAHRRLLKSPMIKLQRSKIKPFLPGVHSREQRVVDRTLEENDTRMEGDRTRSLTLQIIYRQIYEVIFDNLVSEGAFCHANKMQM